MPNIELDKTDLKILAALQKNGRLTNVELAETVALSPSPCLRRLKQLEESGVIRQYVALLEPGRIGLGLQAFVRVQLKSHDAPHIEAFARQVNLWPEVMACHALTGDMDYLLHVVVRNLDHFSRFLLDKLLAQAEVDDVNSSFVLRTVKRAQGLALGD